MYFKIRLVRSSNEILQLEEIFAKKQYTPPQLMLLKKMNCFCTKLSKPIKLISSKTKRRTQTKLQYLWYYFTMQEPLFDQTFVILEILFRRWHLPNGYRQSRALLRYDNFSCQLFVESVWGTIGFNKS